MNKKLLLIPFAIGLVFYIIYEIMHEDGLGNKFEMVVVDESTDVAESKDLKGVTLFLDNSGSMKGFLDFASMKNGNEANATFISTLSNFMDRVKSSYSLEPVCNCGGEAYSRSGFLAGMENFSIFKGAVTELHKLINELILATTDSTVTVLASDMILSYGKKELEQKGKFYNKQQLEQLGAYVHDAMTDAKIKGYDAMLLQYYGDFNGKYYCNYTENIDPNPYSDKLMQSRPFYLLLIGKEKYLKGLAANHMFTGAKHRYATFDVPEVSKILPYTIKLNDNNVAWLIGNPASKDINADGTIMTNNDFGKAKSALKITFNKFNVPAYINLTSEGKLKPEWNENIIENVIIESSPEANEQSMIVTLKEHESLISTKDVIILLCSDNKWVEEATVDDDTKGDDIKEKTWGLSTIVSNINKVYRSEETLKSETIAKLTFDVVIE